MRKLIFKLIWLTPFFLTLVGVNYYVDPGFYFSNGAFEGCIRLMNDGKNIAPVHFEHVRHIHEAVIKQSNSRKDVVVFGSSKCIRIDDPNGAPKAFYNNWVPNGSISDHLAILGFYEETGHLPKNVILEFRPSMFEPLSKHAPVSYRKSFERMLPLIGAEDQKTQKLNWDIAHLKMEKLFSTAYFLHAVKNGQQIPDVYPIKDSLYVMEPNGSMPEYPFDQMDLTPSKITKVAQFKAADITNRDTNSFIVFDKMVRYLKQNDVKVLLLVPPIHPKVFAHEAIISVIPQWQSIIDEAKSAHQINSIGNINPKKLGITEEDFVDHTHMTYAGTRKIFKSN